MKEPFKEVHVDLVFKAFSDPTRLRVLNLLLDGEICVCDLVAILKVPQPKVSRHLSYLRRAGLVKMRKEGLWCHYRLAPARAGFHAKMIECLRGCIECVPQLRADQKGLKKKSKGCC